VRAGVANHLSQSLFRFFIGNKSAVSIHLRKVPLEGFDDFLSPFVGKDGGTNARTLTTSPSSTQRPSRLSTTALWSGERSLALCIIDFALSACVQPKLTIFTWDCHAERAVFYAAPSGHLQSRH
jgi:hypothetical protein